MFGKILLVANKIVNWSYSLIIIINYKEINLSKQ